MKNCYFLMILLGFAKLGSAQTNTFPTSGNAGIGTTNPLAVLDIRGGNILVKNLMNETNESVIMIDHSLSFGQYANFGTSLRTFTENQGVNTYALQFFTQNSYLTGQTEKLRINGNGNIGIGTTSPQEKLTVAGKIGAREIKVATNAGADFVFEQGYKLSELTELEEFVKTNKHLPEIPTARQMVENGVNLGELNIKLLQKIEELTLYLIEKDKQLKNEKEVNKKQQEQIDHVIKELTNIKKTTNK
ncbi:hypothetical protein QF042_001881 [Pedobacter sp. W3I1]|uniref:hypothetical protein n=1 Tax=Pedobacter sp. W3I1 TaxID=3042291 RepID=UPI00278819D4|nr:hypothetical protein [Pedobacter sp. W3I1]MDQ0638316.1 hypothetical protein [Pedobacter sp. W3I1]